MRTPTGTNALSLQDLPATLYTAFTAWDAPLTHGGLWPRREGPHGNRHIPSITRRPHAHVPLAPSPPTRPRMRAPFEIVSTHVQRLLGATRSPLHAEAAVCVCACAAPPLHSTLRPLCVCVRARRLAPRAQHARAKPHRACPRPCARVLPRTCSSHAPQRAPSPHKGGEHARVQRWTPHATA